MTVEAENPVQTSETGIETGIQKIEFNITDTKLAEMSEKFMVLKLTDFNDKVGFNKIVEYRKEVKDVRVNVEKKRKELKAKSLKFGKDVDLEAKRVTALLLVMEDHLIEQENVVKKEKERIQAEKQKKIEEAHQVRRELAVSSGAVFNGVIFFYGDDTQVSDFELCSFSEKAFSVEIEKIKLWKEKEALKLAAIEEEKKAEEKRQAKIAADQKIEQDRLNKVAEEQAEQAEKIRIAQAKIAEEKRKNEEEKKIEEAKKQAVIDAEEKHKKEIEEAKQKAIEAEKQHKLEIEEAKQKAIENAKKEKAAKIEAEKLHKQKLEEAKQKAIEDAKKVAIAKIEAEKKKKLAEEKKAQMLPEKEKLLELSEKFLNPNLPELKSIEGGRIIEMVKSELKILSSLVIESTNDL